MDIDLYKYRIKTQRSESFDEKVREDNMENNINLVMEFMNHHSKKINFYHILNKDFFTC